LLTLSYSKSRQRHVLDGRWEKWGPKTNGPAADKPDVIEEFWSYRGKVSGQAGPFLVSSAVSTIAIIGNAQIPRLEQLVTKPSCEDIMNPAPHRGSVQERRPPPLESISLKDRQFDGTVEEFAAALPGYFQRAAQAIGVNPVDFKKDTEFVVATIKKCAQLTAPFAPGADEGCYGFGTQDRFRKYDKSVDRALVIFMDGIPDRLQKGDSRPFTARVQFTALDSDQTNWDWGPNVNFGSMFGTYGIVSAKIR
jgi:hypothetical protein